MATVNKAFGAIYGVNTPDLSTTAATLNIAIATGNVAIGNATSLVTIGNNLSVTGDLLVSGNTVTINTSTISVEDKNIEMGVVSTPSNTTADGGGITLKGGTDKTINWVNATAAWTSSEHFDLASGKTYNIGGVAHNHAATYQPLNSTLNAVAAGTYSGDDSITTVGTIATGVWNGTTIKEAYGGTNQSQYVAGDILYASAANVISRLPNGSSGQILAINAANLPAWTSASPTGVTAINFAGTGLTPATSSTGDITVGGTLVVGNGGTGLTTVTSGNVLIGNAAGAFTNLSRSGIDNRTTFPTGTVAVGNGGTNLTTLTSDYVVTGNGAGTVVMVSRSGIDNRATFPTGTVTVGNGGTGVTTIATGEVMIGNTAGAITTLSRSGIDNRASFPTGTVTVGNGGTNLTTLTADYVLTGNTAGTVVMVSRSGIDNRATFPPTATYIGTTATQASSTAQALTGITSVAFANGQILTNTATIASASAGQVIFTGTNAGSGAKFIIKAESAGAVHITELLAVGETTNLYLTEYGSVMSGTALGTYTGTYTAADSGTMTITVTPASATSTIFKTMAFTINE